MKFSEFLLEDKIEKANSRDELIASIKDGYFTKDGSHLTITNGVFDLDRLGLRSLKGCPQRVDGDFCCNHNHLTTLEGGPTWVGGYYMVRHNKLENVDNIAEHIGGSLGLENNNLAGLHNIHKHLKFIKGNIYLANNPVKGFLLGTLLIKACQSVWTTRGQQNKLTQILNNYLPNTKGNQAVMQCQTELIEADYRDYARL